MQCHIFIVRRFKMKSIEEMLASKLLDLVEYALSKVIKPDFTVDKVSQLNAQKIEELREIHGIEGIILDVDETIRKDMKNIPKCNEAWLESLKGKIKIIILSNGVDGEIEKYFKDRGIDYIGFANKPLKKNFIKACEKMSLSPDKVLVVGNSLFCDIHGGKRNKMKTVLVKDVDESER